MKRTYPFCRMRFFRIALASLFMLVASDAHAQTQKPNILVIFGDDIGQANVSAYSIRWMNLVFIFPHRALI